MNNRFDDLLDFMHFCSVASLVMMHQNHNNTTKIDAVSER